MIKKITDFCFPFVALFLCHAIIFSQTKVEITQPVNTTTDVTLKTATPTPTPKPDEPATPLPENAELAGVKVKLYYFREAPKIVALLKEVKKMKGGMMANLVIENASDDEIILYGPEDQRDRARRIIVTLDLPRPGISMDMWGVQISSRDPEKLANVMIEAREIIDETQQDIQKTFSLMQQETRKALINDAFAVDEGFQKILEKDLRFELALNPNRPLSFTDILLLLISSKNPGLATVEIAQELHNFGRRIQKRRIKDEFKNSGKTVGEKKSKAYQDCRKAFLDSQGTNEVCIDSLLREEPAPFHRFFESRGLKLDNNSWTQIEKEVKIRSWQSQIAVAQFALQYGRLVHDPNDFSPYYLQQSSEIVNSRLQDAVDTLNADLQELFVIPTLIKIQRAARFKEVIFAQVGKTRVATLSGTSTDVSSSTVSAFEERPPLKLSDLLTKADALTKQVTPFDPAANVVGALPLAQVVGLIGAFGEEKSVWRELDAGVSITVTPNVLRNMTSAELKLKVITSDPKNGTTDTSVPPLSRVSKHQVTTSVYVNALDFFDISSFNTESTLGGGRGYVPVIGPIWRGLFYDIPVFGRLFSWKRSPQTVHHESLILTTSFITPTVMGVALLYPTRDDEAVTDAEKKEKEEKEKKCSEAIKNRKDACPLQRQENQACKTAKVEEENICPGTNAGKKESVEIFSNATLKKISDLK